jgi:ATP-dependent Lon protease
MFPITNLNHNLSSDKVDKKKYKNKKYRDDIVSNVDDIDETIEEKDNDNEYGDNDDGSSSDNDSDDSNSSNNDRILIAIKWIKSIINKNITRKMNTSRLLNIIKDEIKAMKKTLFECKKCKNKKFIKELNEELVYYDDLVSKLDKEYELNNNFDILKYIEKIEDEYRKSFENPEPNKITNFPELVFTILLGQNEEENSQTNQNINYSEEEKNKDKEYNQEFDKLYNFDTTTKNTGKYFNNLDLDAKKTIIEKLKEIKSEEQQIEPNFIKILNSNMSLHNKTFILSKLNQFENLRGNSEHFKLKTWINKVMKIPFDNYVKPPILKNDEPVQIKKYLEDVRFKLNDGIYGHEMTKEQLVKIVAQTITNPEEGGNIFALQGPPGVGKTALINDGIAKALDRPFSFISLGGATDSSFLEGHDYTYEGSSCGRIVDILIQTKCMNPIIYFDELDKVSDTPKGEEIINILMHITDATQNSHFNDKYFGNIDLDLSKVIMIFSFNDESKVSRILRDRMKIIKVKGYKNDDKIQIARNYILPKLFKSVGLTDIRVIFYKEIIEFIIDNYTNEGGVRKLKEILSDILLEINLRKLEDKFVNNKKIKDEIIINKTVIENDFLKKKRKFEPLRINEIPKVGVVNGLWANELGIGGLIPIECCWIPAAEKLDLELTGMQGKVMKESMSVARTISWRILPDNIKTKITNHWKKSYEHGIHIHCPDGATPKDGPSAGGAITTCLISLLTGIAINNKIAMTGEINLKGKITAIGGLEDKLFGAKQAGAELVLCPKENEKDLNEIIEKFPNLFCRNFNVEMIEDIWQILDKVLIQKCEFVRF